MKTATTCPHPTCTARIQRVQFACRPHWFALTEELRRKIWKDYRAGHLEAILENYETAEQIWSAA